MVNADVINIASPPFSAAFSGNERTKLVAAVNAAVAAGKPLYIPGHLSATVLNAGGSIPVTGDLTIIGSGKSISSITAGPDPITVAGESLFLAAPGVKIQFIDITLHGPVTNSVAGVGVCFGVQHQGTSGLVRFLRSDVDGFGYGCLAAWPAVTTEGRGDLTCGTTSGSAVVTDAAAVSGDVGKRVQGPGIPVGTTISSVVNGVSFTMSANATATATTWLVIGGSAFSSMGAATVEILEGSSIEGNGGVAVFVQGTGRLYIRGGKIPRWGTNASNQYHGVYVHTGVTVDVNGLEFGTVIAGSLGYTFHTFHFSGVPDYVRLDNVSIVQGSTGFLTNPLAKTRLSRFDITTLANPVLAWGDVDMTDGSITCTAVHHVRPNALAQLPRNPKVRLRRVSHIGLAAGSVKAIDSSNGTAGDYAVSDCEYDTPAASAFNHNSTALFHQARSRFSDSVGVGAGPGGASRLPATNQTAGAEWEDTDLGVTLVADGSGGYRQRQRDILTFPTSLVPGVGLNGQSTTLANRIFYLRNLGGAAAITKLAVQVTVQSGNFELGVYANTGSGRAAKPGARKGTTGLITVPAVGYQEISLGGTVNMQQGDWLAVIIDNTTAKLNAANAQSSSNLFLGMALFQDSLTGLPSTATPAATGLSLPFSVIGIP